MGPDHTVTEAQTAVDTLLVCTRCRAEGQMVTDEERPGYRLAKALHARFAPSGAAQHDMALRGVACMSQCNRPCVIALSGPGKYTLLFGDLDPAIHADDILKLAERYAITPGGLIARADRPQPLRAGILGRVPPLSLLGDAIDATFTLLPPSNSTKLKHLETSQ